MIRLLVLRTRLAFYRWAAREIDPMHPDVDRVTVRRNELEHQWRRAIVDVRQWQATSPTLSAVKNWLKRNTVAKITITIEDAPDGRTVKVTADPNFETMARMNASGHQLTSAHGYALRAMNAIREASREQSNTLGIIIPKIGR